MVLYTSTLRDPASQGPAGSNVRRQVDQWRVLYSGHQHLNWMRWLACCYQRIAKAANVSLRVVVVIVVALGCAAGRRKVGEGVPKGCVVKSASILQELPGTSAVCPQQGRLNSITMFVLTL